ncbi:hypothetical protein OAX95_00425 [bacterium]|nr:hypothetical protein [bacterium]
MFRALLVTTIVATLALSACGGSDGGSQANSEETATTTNEDSGDLEAWCLGWGDPLPQIEEPISNEDVQTRSEAEQRRNEAMLEVAPAEIAEANQAFVDAGRELNAYFADNDWDPDTPRLTGATGEYELAGSELMQFANDNC